MAAHWFHFSANFTRAQLCLELEGDKLDTSARISIAFAEKDTSSTKNFSWLIYFDMLQFYYLADNENKYVEKFSSELVTGSLLIVAF